MIIERVGVIGAGMMGTEIALVFALSGADVRLTDSSPEQLGRAVDRLTGLLDKAVARGTCSRGEAEATLARLDTASHLEEQADRQLLIEAVFEDEEVKAEVLRRLDDLADAEAILASNTSSISISVLAGRLGPERRRRFLGMHFFSPVSRMKLVEVIPGFDTDAEVVAAAMAACRAAGKEPIRVKDVAGFAVNRLLHAFWIEANRLVEEGVASPADIDAACKFGLGHPVGPYELMDRVTNHLTLQVQEILHEAYWPRFMPRPLLKQMVRAGRDGRVTGRGWFDYGDGA